MTDVLPPRTHSESEDQLVAAIVHESEPEVAEAIVAGAVPIDFNEGLLDTLLPPDADAHALMDELVTLPFVTRTNGDCAYYAPARRTILKLARDENIDHVRELNAAAARYYESRLQELIEGPDRERDERALLYHLLGAGGEQQDRGYALLVRLVGQAESEHRPGVVFLLLQMAREQEPLLTDDHRLALHWLNARLLMVQNQPKGAVKELTDLLALPLSPALQAEIELTLANALCRTGQWADAVIHSTNAHKGFGQGQPFDDARARIAQSQAYAGLALSVRGTRAVRPPLSNRLLNVLARAFNLLERLPVLVYLVLVLGPARTLPALGRIAADQDWVVARFFVSAAVALRRAETLLRSVAEKDPARKEEIEVLQIDVERASADLYRTLGHPAYSVELLGDVLQTDPVRDNEYREAEIRRRLGESLLDLDETALAIEALQLCIPVFESVQDTANEAQSRLMHATALLRLNRSLRADKALARGSHNSTVAVTELIRSQDLYAALGDRAGQAEVGRVLDGLAADADEDAGTRAIAEAAAARSRERRFPIRYAHPGVRRFRTVALAVLAAGLLLILFFSLRTGTQTEIGATALISAGPVMGNSAEFYPTMEIQLPEQQLRPHFRAQFAALSLGIMLLLYLIGYTVLGLGLISLSSPEALRKAQAGAIVMDDEGVWREAITRSRVAGLNEDEPPAAPNAVLPWNSVREAYETDRCVVDRPLASYSRMDLFGQDASLAIPGQTVSYEGELSRRVRQHLPVKPKNLGYSVFMGWSGPLIVLTLLLNVLLLIAGSRGLDIATAKLIGPYSLTDLYLYTYVLFLAPLAWLLVVNPVRQTLVLSPRARWPIWLGLAGLVFQAFFIVAPPIVAGRMPLPRIYPSLIGAVLVAAGSVFVLAVRHGASRPSERSIPVYPLPIRVVAAAILLLSLAAAVIYTVREVRAYHAVVVGNEYRDWAAGRADDEATRAALHQAELRYREAISLTSHASAVYAQLAAVLSGLGRNQEALDEYQKALEYRTDRLTLYANLAAAYQQSVRGQSATSLPSIVALTEAANNYRFALAADPNNTEWQLRLGMVYHQLKRFDDAQAIYRKILQRDPDNVDALVGEAWALVQKGADAQRQRDAATKNVNALSAQRAKVDAGKDPQAAADLDRQIVDASVDSEHNSNLSSTYYLASAEDFRRALDLLTQEAQTGAALPSSRSADIELNRRIANVDGGLGIVQLRLGQYLLAIQYFEAAADAEPTNPDYLISAGNVHWLVEGGIPKSDTPAGERLKFERHLQAAVQSYVKALSSGLPLAPERDRSYLYRTLGQFYYLLQYVRGHNPTEELKNAVDAYVQAIALRNDKAYHENRGKIAAELANKLAATDWNQARPTYALALNELETARSMGTTTLSTLLSQIYATYGRGLYFNDGGTDAAIEEMTHARDLAAPNSAELLRALYHLGLMSLANGNLQDAQQDYDRANTIVAGTKNAGFAGLEKEALGDLQKFVSAQPEIQGYVETLKTQLQAQLQPQPNP